jgi:hypothetical protein
VAFSGSSGGFGVMSTMTSKADPASRSRGIGFRIGDIFSADDTIARWATVVAMAANNTIYLNVRMIEGDLPPELHTYYFKLLAGHFFEAADWLMKSRKLNADVDRFVSGLDQEAQDRYERIVALASQKHPLHDRLRRSRATLFHYPDIHPDKHNAGAEELGAALEEAKDLEGWIEGGEDYASFRATFADEVALQFLAKSEAEMRDVIEQLRDPVFELVEFAEAVLLAHLKRKSPLKTTIWGRGQARPKVPLR